MISEFHKVTAMLATPNAPVQTHVLKVKIITNHARKRVFAQIRVECLSTLQAIHRLSRRDDDHGADRESDAFA